ncbi:MAG: DNA (cytosine-5-)-methyltransferase [Alphaproteobacteria bacterium]|nr:DNA (cytosine-5-)-methyltransferase [Alphaproteobacteria bacterium]
MTKDVEGSMKEHYSISEVADMLSVSKETLRRWDKNGKLQPIRHPINNYRVYHMDQLRPFEQLGFLFQNREDRAVAPNREFQVVELFAGAGGMALGWEKAGLECAMLNDVDKWACETLKNNRPDWNVIHDSITDIDFKPYKNKVDVVTGGFPCQAFSYAGKKMGFQDTRGTMFYEYARAVKEINPKICIAENVRGLLAHEDGRTVEVMKGVLNELGYTVIEPRVLKAIFYRVPQKRERLIIVAIRNDLAHIPFEFPEPYSKIYTVKDALKKGELFDKNVPKSPGQKYPEKKAKVMDLVPPGGYWRDLPLKIQKEYMMESFYLGGGKTGMARRMSWDEPCLTLTCAPAQKQTERCHPDETRPFTVREYARIQTFPDDWQFSGSVSQQYKQIGNAVPVNLAYEVGISVIRFLNAAEKKIKVKLPKAA